jgi:hypothetical protein
LSNTHSPDPTNGGNGGNGNSGGAGSHNGNAFVSRRDIRANNATGALPVINVGAAKSNAGYAGSFDFEALLVSLHELFEHDRQVASQQEATRCGICYLYFTMGELHYRDEGFYVCVSCEQNLGKQSLPMLRKQQK